MHILAVFDSELIRILGTKIPVAFTFTVVIYGFHNGNLLKSPLGGHICGEIFLNLLW